MGKCEDSKDMYQLICKERFDRIDEKQDDILGLLRGRNNEPGILDDMRQIKSRWKAIFGAVAVLWVVLVGKIIEWIISKF